MGAASVAYVLVGIGVQPVSDAPFVLLVLLVLAALVVTLRLLPAAVRPTGSVTLPGWDLPARVVVGTVLVVTLTAVAPHLGPVASGLVATFPVYVSIVAVFEHHRAGPEAAVSVLRGLMTGLFGTVAFYVVVWTLVVPAGVVVAFSVAVAVTTVVGAASLRVLRGRLATADAAPEPI
jgi:hypothetical protein